MQVRTVFDNPIEQKFWKGLGRSIQKARKFVRLNQSQVAHELGVPRTAVTQMELGNRRVSTLEIARMAKLFKCTVYDLVKDLVDE